MWRAKVCAKPATTVVGSRLRTSPQLRALANGVASHGLDFDLSYLQGQLTASLIPALLPLAESLNATQAEMVAAYIVGFEVASRLSRSNPNHNGGGAWHGTGTSQCHPLPVQSASATAVMVPRELWPLLRRA